MLVPLLPCSSKRPKSSAFGWMFSAAENVCCRCTCTDKEECLSVQVGARRGEADPPQAGRSPASAKTPSPQRLCSTPSVRRPWLLRAARLRPEYGHGHPHASCIAHEPRSGAASSTLARGSLGSQRLLEGILSSALVAALLAGGVLHLGRSLLDSSTPLTLGVDDRSWPLQALGRARVA